MHGIYYLDDFDVKLNLTLIQKIEICKSYYINTDNNPTPNTVYLHNKHQLPEEEVSGMKLKYARYVHPQIIWIGVDDNP